MFKSNSIKNALNREIEEKLFEQAYAEIEAGIVRKGLMAKALAKSNGDVEKADALYLNLRVQSLIDEEKIALAKEEMLQVQREQAALAREHAQLSAENNKKLEIAKRVHEEQMSKHSLKTHAIVFFAVIAAAAFLIYAQT